MISDPDVRKVNIDSRERLDVVEAKLVDLIGRMYGVRYFLKNLIINRRIADEDVEIHLDGSSDDNSVSGSSE